MVGDGNVLSQIGNQTVKAFMVGTYDIWQMSSCYSWQLLTALNIDAWLLSFSSYSFFPTSYMQPHVAILHTEVLCDLWTSLLANPIAKSAYRRKFSPDKTTVWITTSISCDAPLSNFLFCSSHAMHFYSTNRLYPCAVYCQVRYLTAVAETLNPNH